MMEGRTGCFSEGGEEIVVMRVQEVEDFLAGEGETVLDFLESLEGQRSRVIGAGLGEEGGVFLGDLNGAETFVGASCGQTARKSARRGS